MAMSRKAVANVLTVMLPKMSSSYPATSSAHTPSHQTVQHDRGRHRFSIKLDDSRDEAVLRYKYIGNKMIDVYSTSVPHKFRGHGIGVQLAQAALNFIVEDDLKVRISCWFVRKYVQDNPQPQYKDRILN